MEAVSKALAQSPCFFAVLATLVLQQAPSHINEVHEIVEIVRGALCCR